MKEIEALAASWGCEEITLNTMMAENASSAAFWDRLGLPYDPTARINEHWYAKMGYKSYKTAPRYEQINREGVMELLEAVVGGDPSFLENFECC